MKVVRGGCQNLAFLSLQQIWQIIKTKLNLNISSKKLGNWLQADKTIL